MVSAINFAFDYFCSEEPAYVDEVSKPLLDIRNSLDSDVQRWVYGLRVAGVSGFDDRSHDVYTRSLVRLREQFWKNVLPQFIVETTF